MSRSSCDTGRAGLQQCNTGLSENRSSPYGQGYLGSGGDGGSYRDVSGTDRDTHTSAFCKFARNSDPPV
jgi:hypothetical protein